MRLQADFFEASALEKLSCLIVVESQSLPLLINEKHRILFIVKETLDLSLLTCNHVILYGQSYKVSLHLPVMHQQENNHYQACLQSRGFSLLQLIAVHFLSTLLVVGFSELDLQLKIVKADVDDWYCEHSSFECVIVGNESKQ